jgi:integrase
MAKVNLKYIQAFKDRHGRMRHYYRRKGFPTVVLPGEAGSAEFMAAYADTHAACTSPQDAARAAGMARVQPRSINALIIEYYRSASFIALKPTSQRPYRRILDRFRAAHGDKGVTSVQSHHLNAILHGMAATPHAAVNLRKRLSKVFKLAVRLGWRADNPVRETELDPVKTRGHIPWSEAEIETFEARWPSGSRERLALALLVYTGQRRSDVVQMGNQHVSDGRISVAQHKGGARLKIPIHPRLQAEIDQQPLTMAFLTTQYNAPFTAAGFTNWFVARARDAGLANRTPHGLRKSAGRRLAEAQCSTKQIAAITGHKTLSEVERYTRDADQGHLADSAMDKLQEAESRTPRVKPV